MNSAASPTTAAPIKSRYPVHVTRDVAYARALVGVGRPEGGLERELKLDVYEPLDHDQALRPAIIAAFGGAFHRGSKEDDTFLDGGSSNTSISAYCAEFASRGYVSVSIDYRLVTEDPDPGSTRVVSNPNSVPRSRVDHVRGLMGLPRATPDMLWRGVEAASDDMAAAFRFVEGHSDRWRIDPARIAVGGFSAGGRSALNAAYGERVGAAAVFALSGFMATDDLSRLVTGQSNDPPVLLVSGENDLDYVRHQAPIMANHFAAVGVPVVAAQVIGRGHFYGRDAVVRSSPQLGDTLETTLGMFLDRWLRNREPV